MDGGWRMEDILTKTRLLGERFMKFQPGLLKNRCLVEFDGALEVEGELGRVKVANSNGLI